MLKKIPLYAVIIIVITAIMLTFQVTCVLTYRNYSEEKAEIALSQDETKSEIYEKVASKIAELDACYRENYLGEIASEDELVNWAATGYVVGTGDKYGEYMDPETYKAFIADSAGEDVGIGILVSYDREYGNIEIVNVMPDSPALKAGVKIGDILYKVGDEYAAELGYTETLNRMRGEVGTTAEFSVLRNDEEIEMSIVRDKYTVVSVMSHMYEDGKTGIIRILEFDKTPFTEFRDALIELEKQGATQFVFDVRNNPGGMLTSITDVLDMLVPEGPIIRIVDKTGETVGVISSDPKETNVPMVVLANRNTASAGELFTAALRDYKKAKIVGTTTYGKGSMQTVFPFKDGSALRITIENYLPPFSDGYDGEGIKPDVEIEMPQEKQNVSLFLIEDENDDQLLKAIEVLNEK